MIYDNIKGVRKGKETTTNYSGKKFAYSVTEFTLIFSLSQV